MASTMQAFAGIAGSHRGILCQVIPSPHRQGCVLRAEKGGLLGTCSSELPAGDWLGWLAGGQGDPILSSACSCVAGLSIAVAAA